MKLNRRILALALGVVSCVFVLANAGAEQETGTDWLDGDLTLTGDHAVPACAHEAALAISADPAPSVLSPARRSARRLCLGLPRADELQAVRVYASGFSAPPSPKAASRVPLSESLRGPPAV